jgi:hypothetical protein
VKKTVSKISLSHATLHRYSEEYEEALRIYLQMQGGKNPATDEDDVVEQFSSTSGGAVQGEGSATNKRVYRKPRWGCTYNLNPVDPQLESARFQPLSLPLDPS